MKLLVALLACLASTAAVADETVLRFYGYAYDLKTNAYLYTEVHHQKVVDGRWVGGTIGYYTPAGEKFGSKTLDFSQDEFVPLYRLELPALGYYEAITGARDRLDMEKRSGTGKPVQTKSLEKLEPLCGDSGFHSFVRAHFAELMAGTEVHFRLAVAGSLDYYKFRARRIEDTTFEKHAAVRFRVEPDSFLRFLADPLELTYDPAEMKLYEYRGISNVHDPQTGTPYNTRIAYYSQPPAEVIKLPPME